MIAQRSFMGMARTAPIRQARSSEPSRREMAMTSAPACAAIRVSAAPMKPTPTIATRWPAAMPDRRTMFMA